MENIENVMLAGKKWGLVLNGGGGKGSYQIGVFKALREMKLVDSITAVSGSSVGSLNMCLWLFDDGICKSAWESVTQDKMIDIDIELLDGSEGFVSREGLIEIMNDYVNLERVSNSPVPLVASVSQYDAQGNGQPVSKYMMLNGRRGEEIKTIVLASSALPFIYEPVEINGLKYRDGGLTDNMPIKPLYEMGLRNMIVVCTSPNMPDLSAYPDVEFLVIRPSISIGEFVDGTLDFNPNGVKRRMELGYLDGMRNLRYYGNPYINLQEIAEIELRNFEAKYKADDAVSSTEAHMNKLQAIYDKFDSLF